jgi:hypothetical protein
MVFDGPSAYAGCSNEATGVFHIQSIS